jgi:hypothetical protein
MFGKRYSEKVYSVALHYIATHPKKIDQPVYTYTRVFEKIRVLARDRCRSASLWFWKNGDRKYELCRRIEKVDT